MRITLDGADRARWERFVSVQEHNAAVLELYSRFLNTCPDGVEPGAMQELMGDYGLDAENAYRTLFAALCGLDASGAHRMAVERYLVPSIRRLDAAAYRANPYILTVHFPESSLGRWRLCTQSYRPYEAFVRGEIQLMEDGREIPLLGFFEEAFTYPAVLEAGREWMTVTPNEIETMAGPLKRASGHVCAFGLGLGYFAFMASQKSEVTRVTVVERDPAVIALFREHILPQFPHGDKVRVVEADAFDFASRPMAGVDMAFVDLWHDVADGVPLYGKMKALEPRHPGVRFAYWIEPSLLSNLRFRLLGMMEDALTGGTGTVECLPDLELDGFDAVRRALSDDALRAMAGAILP